MKYQPSRHVSIIGEREDDYCLGYADPPLFDTWEKAHDWMRTHRQHEVSAAKARLKWAKESQSSVLAMRPKNKIG
jgi:hypothetical protein